MVKRSSIRGFATTQLIYNKAAKKTEKAPKKEETMQQRLDRINSEIAGAKKHSALKLDDASLILRPDLWMGLPDDLILRLYHKRVVGMGKAYRRSKEELDALLSTAKNVAEAIYIEKVYYDTESNQFDADTETDYENFLTEGEYMDDSYEANEYDEYPTVAQDIVRDFRDQLAFNRKAAYELPSLAKFKQEYKPVSAKDKPVVYKYTSFLGEENPAERKVVLQLKVSDLSLKEAEAHKLKLLAGPRYDYTTDLFKISSDKFLEPAQNATYLSDILDDLIAESKKDPKEFADVPLDTRAVDARMNKRQHKNKRQYTFPKSWEKPISAKERPVDLRSVVELD